MMKFLFDVTFWFFRIFVILLLLCGFYYFGYDRASNGHTLVPDISNIITKEELAQKFETVQRRLYESQP